MVPLSTTLVRILALVVAATAYAHSPTVDADLSDWCLYTTPRVENRSAVLHCLPGTEVVWWDAPADAAVNDLAVAATTQDETDLYWAVGHHVPFDPILLPFLQLAIDVGPGGSNLWWDPQGALQAPGHCSIDTSRRCTRDEDCHFCAVSTEYTGTPHEQPRVCGSTDWLDLCNDLDVTDVCNREQTCLGLASAPPAPSVGAFATSVAAPDYLLVFDFGRWLIGVCDSINLLRNDSGTWVEIPRPIPDPLCPNPTWRFTIVVAPGTGQPRPHEYEIAVPWEAFDCAGCAPFGPGDEFRWTMEVSRGELNLDYQPDGAIEDVMTEAVAGAWTTTSNGCAVPGTSTILCELADGSADALVPLAPTPPGGQVDGLVLERNESGPTPSITLTWHPSCSNSDTDYAIYEGEIGVWYSHVAPASGAICSSGGAVTATFDAGEGDRYYLVVPRDTVVEGSYGVDGGALERPPSTVPCAAPYLGGCPPF
jgi:hypothetical protein